MGQASESAAFQGRFHTLSESQQPALVAVHGTLVGGHKFSDWAQQVEMSGHSDSRCGPCRCSLVPIWP